MPSHDGEHAYDRFYCGGGSLALGHGGIVHLGELDTYIRLAARADALAHDRRSQVRRERKTEAETNSPTLAARP